MKTFLSIQYGLYDRPELKTWYKGRVVLLGDAAHPTTPVRMGNFKRDNFLLIGTFVLLSI